MRFNQVIMPMAAVALMALTSLPAQAWVHHVRVTTPDNHTYSMVTDRPGHRWWQDSRVAPHMGSGPHHVVFDHKSDTYIVTNAPRGTGHVYHGYHHGSRTANHHAYHQRHVYRHGYRQGYHDAKHGIPPRVGPSHIASGTVAQ